MIIAMAVSLYTARVVIKVIGIDDYGIYNIVGGVVVLFSFVNSALRSSTQRFVSYELGKNDVGDVNRVFNSSLLCHALYAVLFVVASLTVGLWLVVTKLQIPADRTEAAYLVYTLSVITFVFNIFQAPYHAAIIAFEKMSFYAFISIFDVLFKLIIVFVLLYFGGDKLIVYAYLLLLVSVITLALSALYTYKKLAVGRLRFVSDYSLFKKLFGYAGWSMFNGLSFIGAQQGGNILINIYNGVAANGAFGIANQVSNILYSFVTNFQSAIEPQVVKAFSAKQFKEMFALMNRASYFSYYIFLLIAVPLLSQIDYVLALWLGDCPEFAANFCRLLLIYYLVDAIEAPLWMLIGATGNVKVYSIWSGTLTLMNIPLSLVLLVMGFSVYWVFIVRVVINVITAIIRPMYVKFLIKEFSLREYVAVVLSRVGVVSLLIILGFVGIKLYLSNIHPLLIMILAFIYTSSIVWIGGINKDERMSIVKVVKDKIGNVL